MLENQELVKIRGAICFIFFFRFKRIQAVMEFHIIFYSNLKSNVQTHNHYNWKGFSLIQGL